MLTVIDYGVGNIGSISNMLRKLGVRFRVAARPEELIDANKIIIPGVGAFGNGIEKLHNLGWTPALNKAVLEQEMPVLGICLGAQLMTRGSEEGAGLGLGWIEADTIRFSSKNPMFSLPLPHMGWNTVHTVKKSPIAAQISEESRFYFVHSYHFKCDRLDDVLFTSKYGYEFAAGFSCGNIYGVQFHPEKSHKFGMKLLSNFSLL